MLEKEKNREAGNFARRTVSITFQHFNPQNEGFNTEFKLKLEEIIKLAESSGVEVKADEYAEIALELIETVKKYFEEHIYRGSMKLSKPFELKRIERSDLNSAILYAVPDVDYETYPIEDDDDWEKGLAKIGEEFGTRLKIPYYCRSK